MPGDIQFRFAPETVQQAAAVLKNEFQNNMASRFALYDSVRSVLDENDIDKSITKMLAVEIGNRIFDLEVKR